MSVGVERVSVCIKNETNVEQRTQYAQQIPMNWKGTWKSNITKKLMK